MEIVDKVAIPEIQMDLIVSLFNNLQGSLLPFSSIIDLEEVHLECT